MQSEQTDLLARCVRIIAFVACVMAFSTLKMADVGEDEDAALVEQRLATDGSS